MRHIPSTAFSTRTHAHPLLEACPRLGGGGGTWKRAQGSQSPSMNALAEPKSCDSGAAKLLGSQEGARIPMHIRRHDPRAGRTRTTVVRRLYSRGVQARRGVPPGWALHNSWPENGRPAGQLGQRLGVPTYRGHGRCAGAEVEPRRRRRRTQAAEAGQASQKPRWG